MIIWDEKKNQRLRKERNISFEEIENIIENDNYLAIKKNPKRKEQQIFIIKLHDYIYSAICY